MLHRLIYNAFLRHNVREGGASVLKIENVSPLLTYKDAVIVFMGAGDVQKFEFAYEQLLSSTSPTQN